MKNVSALLFSLGALFFYTTFNLVFARKLAALTPAASVPIYTAVMFILSVCIATMHWETLIPPNSEQYLWLVLCGLCILAADICYVTALNHGGSIALVTTIICLLPVTARFVDALLKEEWPSKTQLVAMLMAIVAVILIANE